MNNYNLAKYNLAKLFYNYIIENNGYASMNMIWVIACVENSLEVYDMKMIITDEDKEKMCNLVLRGWLDSEVSISISKVADIVVENWNELKDSEQSLSLLDDYIEEEVGF